MAARTCTWVSEEDGNTLGGCSGHMLPLTAACNLLWLGELVTDDNAACPL